MSVGACGGEEWKRERERVMQYITGHDFLLFFFIHTQQVKQVQALYCLKLKALKIYTGDDGTEKEQTSNVF